MKIAVGLSKKGELMAIAFLKKNDKNTKLQLYSFREAIKEINEYINNKDIDSSYTYELRSHVTKSRRAEHLDLCIEDIKYIEIDDDE